MGLTSDKYLTPDQEAELLNLTKSIGVVRDRLLIELALYCGARESELITIETCDLNHTERSVIIKRPLKGSKQREIPLPDEFYARLKSYAETINGRLFPISDSRVRQIWMFNRPFPRKFHSLRHTFGRKEYAKTKDILHVRYLLGHSSVSSTQIYTEIDHTVGEMRRAMGL